MEAKTKTQEFLILLTENRTTEAKRLLGQVEFELSRLPRVMAPPQQAVVKELNSIIVRLQEGYDGSAIKKAAPTLANFASYRMHSLIKSFLGRDVTRYADPLSGQGDSFVDLPTMLGPRHRVAGWQNILADFSGKDKVRRETKDLWTFPGIAEQDEVVYLGTERPRSRHTEGEVENEKVSSKKADFNTPVLIAERFVELYENEWTEAFEVLTKSDLSDQSVTKLLLLVVEEAYKFCLREAERQLRCIHSAFQDILQFGSNLGSDRSRPSQLSLVTKYRKDMAVAALPKLFKEFYDLKFKDMCMSVLGMVPKKQGPGNNYANKAVAVTWLMCVQDPPVYMVPTGIEAFDPKLYKAFGKVSNQPDYFVWPALRYSQNGDILQKGVVQYR